MKTKEKAILTKLQYFPKTFAHLIIQGKKIKYKDGFLKTSYILDLTHTFICRKFQHNISESNMWSVILRRRYGTHYNYYIDWLIDYKIIKLKSKWQAGIKAKTYTLVLNLTNEKTTRILNKDQILLRKNNNDELKEMSEIYTKMISDLSKVKVNFDKAIESLSNEYDVGLLDHRKYFKNIMALEQIVDKSIHAVKDDYGRLHTNFTTLKRSIRNNFLSLGDSEMSSLDIKNSQPQFLAKIILETEKKLSPELEKFINSVKEGNFYESFAALDMPRAKIKEMVYCVFFGKNIMIKKETETKNKANQNFVQYWPELWNWIVNWKKNSGNYKTLSHNLQRRESDLIYNHICLEIKEKLPNIIIFTVHDSIFFPIENKEIIEEIFFRNMKKLI
jgi:hypothetical protein